MKHLKTNQTIKNGPGALVLRVFCLFSVLFVGCTSLGDGPYNPGDLYEFDIELQDSLYTFSDLNLKIMESSFFVLQQKVVWEGHYTDHSTGSSSKTTSTTGIVQNENKIWLHPPRIGPLELLEAFPFPEVRFPLKPGQTWKSSINVVSGFKELNGKKVISDYIVIGDTVTPLNSQLRTWEIHARSEIEDDSRSFEVRYQYSPEKGFIWFNYTIDDKPFAQLELVNQ